jgi:hypothetical protein
MWQTACVYMWRQPFGGLPQPFASWAVYISRLAVFFLDHLECQAQPGVKAVLNGFKLLLIRPRGTRIAPGRAAGQGSGPPGGAMEGEGAQVSQPLHVNG